jgi:plastocyanin
MTRHLLLLLLGLPCAAFAEPEIFTIKTLPAQMKYDVTEITVAPGAEIKLRFENPDDMPHNLVFFQPGTDVVEVCNRQLEKPEEALKRNWLPEDPRLWLHSRVLNPREKEELVFKAPEKPGFYPYVCTMPGHALIMQGKLHVAKPGPQLTGLKFQLYLGDWKKLPDFSKVEVHRAGEIPDNLVQLKLDDYKHQFGVVYTGKLTAPKDGDYSFYLASDDGARVSIDGKKVVEHDAVAPASDIFEGKVKLKAGEHDFKLEYFQAGGGADIFTAWKGPGFAITALSKWLHPSWKGGATGKNKKAETTGIPLTVNTEPVLYRNFIEGAGNRGIAVGYPGGFSLAWSAETMNVAVIWRGAFMDAARHWNGRGGGAQPPLGDDLFRPAGEYTPAFAVLATPEAAWPAVGKGERVEGYRWKGYELDAKRVPTFRYEWNGVSVAERFEVIGSSTTPTGKLTRTLKLQGAIPEGALFRAATGSIIQPQGGNTFLVEANGAKFLVHAENAKIAGSNLVLPAKTELQVSYGWASTHQH